MHQAVAGESRYYNVLVRRITFGERSRVNSRKRRRRESRKTEGIAMFEQAASRDSRNALTDWILRRGIATAFAAFGAEKFTDPRAQGQPHRPHRGFAA